jgi:hypothetical protein
LDQSSSAAEEAPVTPANPVSSTTDDGMNAICPYLSHLICVGRKSDAEVQAASSNPNLSPAQAGRSKICDVAEALGLTHSAAFTNNQATGNLDPLQHQPAPVTDQQSPPISLKGPGSQWKLQGACQELPVPKEGDLEVDTVPLRFNGDMDFVSFTMVLTGGGKSAQTDVLHAVRNGWDITVLTGTGGFADVLKKQKELRSSAALSGVPMARGAGDGEEPVQPEFDHVTEEILTYGKLNMIDIESDSVEDCTKNMVASINNNNSSMTDEDSDDILLGTWELYAIYSKSARELRELYIRCEAFITALNVLTTVLIGTFLKPER